MATDRFTAQQVADALTAAKGFVSVAARGLGCADNTVRNYIERYAVCKQAVKDECKLNGWLWIPEAQDMRKKRRIENG